MQASNRRTFLTGMAATTLLPTAPWARAQSGGNVRFVTGFAPGGTTDTVCRAVAQQLAGTAFASTVVVDNRSGANGQIALKHVVSSKPDGTALLLTPDSILAVHPHIYTNLGVDPFVDLAPVSMAAHTVDAWAVGPLVPASVRNIEDFIGWCKANPSLANFGSAGAGSIPHFIGALLAREAAVELRHVQYRGSQAAVTDMVGGQIAAASVAIGDVMRYMESGRVRALATTGPTRTRFAPNVPTFKEQGFDSLEVVQWLAFFAPPKTPPAMVTQANQALRGALSTKAVADALSAFGMEAASSTPAELASVLQTDHKRWGTVVKSTGFKFD